MIFISLYMIALTSPWNSQRAGSLSTKERAAREIMFNFGSYWGYREYMDIYRAAWEVNHFVRITDEDVKQRVRRVPEGRKLVVPKYFPAIRSLTTDDEGRIFAGTYEKPAEGTFVNDVFDSAGRYVAAVALKGKPQVWKKHKLYTIEDDEEGFSVVKRYRVVGNIIGK